jgi:hypothetical protein
MEKMRRSADILAFLSVLAALLALSVTQFAFPPVGFEGMIAVAGLSSGLSILTGLVAMVLCLVIVVKDTGPKPLRPTFVSAAAFCVLAVAGWLA